MTNLKNKTAGFTLIETLVAIAIFAFAITGLITVTGQGVFDTNFVKNKLTAGYLALEGAELVRNVRDTASLNPSLSWQLIFPGPNGNSYLGPCMRDDEQACVIDPWINEFGLPGIGDCPAISCPAMSFNTATGRFGYEVQNNINIFASVFTRTIYILPTFPGSDHEQTVVSEVSWTQGSRTHKVVYTFNLMDWIGS